jgi:hypothetical protein
MGIRMLLVACSLLLASACGGPVVQEEAESAPMPVMEQAPEESTDTSALWLSCPGYDGTPCTTPSNRFRCYNQYPNEPGLCFCGSDYIYTCS